MDAERGCGALHGLYVAAREDGDVQSAWARMDAADTDLDPSVARALDETVRSGDAERLRREVGERLFGESEAPTLSGPTARLLGTLLYAFGYLASFVLFFRAHSRESVVGRLRWAYRTVGVDIRDTETVDGVERTTFRCPYRNLGADRFGTRHVCHDVLDRVDDGYVTWLERHREIDYQRPRACTASACCYSEVADS